MALHMKVKVRYISFRRRLQQPYLRPHRRDRAYPALLLLYQSIRLLQAATKRNIRSQDPIPVKIPLI